MIRERKFLIDDYAQAGDDAENIDSWTVDNENSSVNFSELIPFHLPPFPSEVGSIY